MSMFRSLLIAVLLPSCVCFAQVPPESELPNQPQPTGQVPGEAELPRAGAEQVDPSTPGEQVLPGAAVVNATGGESSTALPSGERPWLRMAMEGHTGIVRALDLADDGLTLLSGGEDKDLHVWRRSDFANRNWFHRRVIRWPITRGPRGRIYALAANGNQVAMAGHGASGRLGEIWVVDSQSGELVRPLINEGDGHRQVIQSLVWSHDADPKQRKLASQDVEGHVMLWQVDSRTGIWSGKTIIRGDVQAYGENIAMKLKPQRGFVPVVFDSTETIITPHFVGFTDDSPPQANWHLQRTNLMSGQGVVLDTVTHSGSVVDLDVNAGGDRMVSVDALGKVTLWVFGAGGTVGRTSAITPGARPLFVDLDRDGQRLLLGTEVGVLIEGQPRARLQIWDVNSNPPKFLSEVYPATHVLAGVINRSHNEALVASANSIEAYIFDAAGKFQQGEPRELRAPIEPARRVAFAKDPKSYEIAIGSELGADGKIKLDRRFDLSRVVLSGKADIDESDFQSEQRQREKWSPQGVNTPAGFRFQLQQGEQVRGVLPLKMEIHGRLTSISTITENPPTGEPQAKGVVVGTAGRNNIYVYRADTADPPKLLRQFRGHTGSVLSTGVSSDGRYLVSGSEDTTVCLWSLADIFSASESVNRWGVEFAIEDERLIAQSVREDGPLHFRGVRGGDRLINISWADEIGNAESESDPTAMLARLTSLPFDALVVFRFTRLGRARPEFQSFAAWQPVASLFVDEDREWALWTPAGYYDASFNGHRRFGWQINRDVNRLPDFFRAAQFREALERPDLMRRLMDAGSLPRAMRNSVSGVGPPPGEDAIVNQYLSKPRIRVISPQPDARLDQQTLTVRAEIEVPLGASLAKVKSFISGVPPAQTRRVASQTPGVETYEWDFRLPRDESLKLEVMAATEAEAIDRVQLDFQRVVAKADASAMPRLHLLAIGVGSYRDPQIQSLDFAAGATQVVADTFRQQAASLYYVTADQLVDRDATRSLWTIYARQAAERLAKVVSPDDLVVMYLCGHGLRDRRTNQWYFITADADYTQLMNDQYDDCLSFSDLALLAQLPCRKLAILDSCHSGAVQPVMRSGDLKSALRFLQDDLVLTFTASEGGEEAAERRETGLGRFTTRLVEALQGAADIQGDNNGVVTLDETIVYVTNAVANESQSEGIPQHPTASPQYLIRELRVPLTSPSQTR